MNLIRKTQTKQQKSPKKGIYENPMANVLFSGERLTVFSFLLKVWSLRSEPRQGKNVLFHHCCSTLYWKCWPEQLGVETNWGKLWRSALGWSQSERVKKGFSLCVSLYVCLPFSLWYPRKSVKMLAERKLNASWTKLLKRMEFHIRLETTYNGDYRLYKNNLEK